MGWANCGTDERGRPIGYAHSARCDKRGCKAKIHRGLAYVCGSMHGGDGIGCGGYFCTSHMTIQTVTGDNQSVQLCAACVKLNLKEHAILDD